MNVERFTALLGADFYTGVPDSLLKALCDYLISRYGTDGTHHIIAANEGNCTALAAGYHLATGKTAVVYLQNSGEGNIVNPVASLCSDAVYGIPVLFIVGWRGEPGVHDEPQHAYQGRVTERLLEDMGIAHFVLDKTTAESQVAEKMEEFNALFSQGKQAAFVVRKGALQFEQSVSYSNEYTLRREDILRHILAVSGDDPIVSTTGKASRELFELREFAGQDHRRDFLTVGSMGHSSSIALGIALQKPDKTVWALDGDGALLMHMGTMAVIGKYKPANLIHIVINNGAHESVGGQPTAAQKLDIPAIARGCGYESAVSVNSSEALDRALADARARRTLSLIEVKSAIGARGDLGRPTTTPTENKTGFMNHLSLLQ